MTVAQTIERWQKARDRADRNTSGVAAATQFTAIDRAAWNVAREPCSDIADIIAKLRFARSDCAERGVVDAVVLALLEGLVGDISRISELSDCP